MPIFKSGQLVYKSPDVKDIRLLLRNISALWEEIRFENPHRYYGSSVSPWDLKTRMLEEHGA